MTPDEIEAIANAVVSKLRPLLNDLSVVPKRRCYGSSQESINSFIKLYNEGHSIKSISLILDINVNKAYYLVSSLVSQGKLIRRPRSSKKSSSVSGNQRDFKRLKKKIVTKERLCLRCREPFLSEGINNRICNKCKQSLEFTSGGGLDEFVERGKP